MRNSDSREASRNSLTPRSLKLKLRFFFLHRDVCVWQVKHIHWEFQCNFANFENILEIPLTFIKQTSLIHSIYRVPDGNWYSRCLKLDRKAAELERTKLQSEIQKEKSELRRKKLENRLKMSGKAGGKGGPAKNLKKTKREPDDDDDDDFLQDLVMDTETDKRQPSYSTLEPGGFVTKGPDRKTRLDQRQAKIAAAAGEAEDDKQETEQEKLEQEAGELTSQLKKAE